MIQDIDVKAMKKNAFRVSKERGMTASRVRVPGGLVSAKSMARIVEIAEEYGRGEIFLTNRQGVEIPGIHMEDMPKVNEKLQAIIEDTKINQEDTSQGYLASGTRNVVACPGKRLCPFGCYDTTAFAQRMDHEIFPNNRHVKVAFTGCSNDCAHVALNDFGIIGMTEPQYDPNRCIGCGQCVDWCQRRSVSALRLEKGKVVRDEDRCIGCGVCVVYCPTRAWTRSPEHYFRVKIMGRTGKQNPRLAQDWLRWVDEDSIVKIVKNTYAFIEEYINPNAPEGKEHIGYIVDRVGFDEFCEWALKDVELPEKCPRVLGRQALRPRQQPAMRQKGQSLCLIQEEGRLRGRPSFLVLFLAHNTLGDSSNLVQGFLFRVSHILTTTLSKSLSSYFWLGCFSKKSKRGGSSGSACSAGLSPSACASSPGVSNACSQEKKSSAAKPRCSQIFSHPAGTAGCMSSVTVRSAAKALASACS